LTVQEALSSSGIDPREARLLLAQACGFSEAAVAAFPERTLPEDTENRFADFVSRRRNGEPIAYIVGHKEFYGLELAVNPAVLIPRPETELLVELALQREFSSVADLGTGSGAVALAIKKHRPEAQVVAVEASAAALAVARRNSTRHGLEIRLVHGLWFQPLRSDRREPALCRSGRSASSRAAVRAAEGAHRGRRRPRCHQGDRARGAGAS